MNSTAYSPHTASFTEELTLHSSAAEDDLPSLSLIFGGSISSRHTTEVLSGKAADINEFYEGLKAPYLSAHVLINSSLHEKRTVLNVLHANKNQVASLAITELEEGLSWALGKLAILEAEREALISHLKA